MVDPVSLLDRAPAPLRRLAYRVGAGRGLLGRLTDAVRFRPQREAVPRLPEAGADPVRLVLGPANSAGQAFRWARAAERLPGVRALSVYGLGRDGFAPDVDLRIPVAVYQRGTAWQDAFEQFLSRQTHVIWESGIPLLGRRYRSGVVREADLLAAQGLEGALMFHGSDIRPPDAHAARSVWSPFRTAGGPVNAIRDTAEANARLVAATSLPVFVSTPDLLEWVPGSTWCPVVVDPARWAVPSRERGAGPPVVIHAPTQRWLKGTDRIEPLLYRLATEGVIDYRPLAAVPHDRMPAIYAEADIVLDQFALGSYGVAACEALAAGRVVLGHVEEETRARIRELTGRELPVHETTIATLESTLRHAARDPEWLAEVRAHGPAFVDDVHNGRRSADVLAPFLGRQRSNA